MSTHPELPERDRRILGVLVQGYIDDGEPISSLWLASRGFGVSSATLRNMLARLEEQGYVRQPHTSAGRVPTDRGYRCLRRSAPGGAALVPARAAGRGAAAARRHSRGSADPRVAGSGPRLAAAELCDRAREIRAALERLDFVPLDGGKILVVVVSTGGHVSHKVIAPAEEYDLTSLQQAANYLNSEFKGQSLLAVRQAVLQRLREERSLYDELMARALRLASTTFEDMTSEPSVFIQGTSLLLEDLGGESPDVTLETLRTLLRMIEEKARLIQLLDEYISADGLTIVIGSEHHSPELQRFTLIASTYSDGCGTGAVGVIGPTRMRYSRAINAVEGLSKAISRMVGGRA